MVNEEQLELGDVVVILDDMLHPTKIKGVITSVFTNAYNVIVSNGLNKGENKKINSLNLRKVENHGF